MLWLFLQLKHVFTGKFVHMSTTQTSQKDKNNMKVSGFMGAARIHVPPPLFDDKIPAYPCTPIYVMNVHVKFNEFQLGYFAKIKTALMFVVYNCRLSYVMP